MATIAKLLVYFRISGGKPLIRENIKKLVFGDIFRQYGIHNLIEEDFFTWFFHRTIYEISIDLVFKLSRGLQVYDLDALDEDILKELYQELVSAEVRHTLGEYYTPDWLAEKIIQEFIDKKPLGSFIDPSCGSGTFLFSIIKKIIPILKNDGLSDQKILEHILNNIIGLDINPLAVIISRTNYLLALKDIIKYRGGGPIILPIYLSDSIKIPNIEYDLETHIQIRKMEASNSYFRFPEEIVKKSILMDEVIEKLDSHAKNYNDKLEREVKSKGDSGDLRQSLIESFERSINIVKEENIKKLLVSNFKFMTELIDSGNDSIWSYILKNILKPVILMSSKFDFIIGNPPWIAMQFMMNSNYKNFLKQETLDYGLILKDQTHLFTHIEMASLFFYKVVDLYLKDKGHISFVMPKSILTALQHQNFINMKINYDKNLKIKIEKIFDCEHIKPLFNIPSCVLFAKKGDNVMFPVPILKFQGKLSGKNEKWNNISSTLKIEESEFYPIPKSNNKYYYYSLFYQGATLFPRNFWFISFNADPNFGFDLNLPYVKSDETNDTKLPWKNVVLEGNVESNFLYATLIGKDILPFGFKSFRPVVLPLVIEDNKYKLMKSSQDPITFHNAFNFSNYLWKAEIEWKEKSKKDSSGILKISSPYLRLDYPQKNLTRQTPFKKYKVLYVATATYLTSCIVSPSDPLEINFEDKIVKLKSFVAESKTYFFETDNELEAFYLCAILNSKFVDDYIKPLQNVGEWGERDIHKRPLLLPIPKYETNNLIHGRIAKLGKICKEKVSQITNPYSKSIGKDRSKIRQMLADELGQIEKLMPEIIKKID